MEYAPEFRNNPLRSPKTIQCGNPVAHIQLWPNNKVVVRAEHLHHKVNGSHLGLQGR